jgi:hypothetical protein
MTKSSVRLNSATGDPLNVAGQINFPFQLGNAKLNQTLQVVDNMNNTLIIGNDAILDKLTINRGRTVTVDTKNGTDIVPIKYAIPRMRIAVASETSFAPNSVRMVKCKIVYDTPVEHTNKGVGIRTVVTDEDPCLDSLVGMESTVTTVNDDETVHCLLANTLCDTVTIQGDVIVGQANPILESTSADKYVHYDEFPSHEQISFLHESKTRDDILSGNPDGFIPNPPGYDNSNHAQRKPVDVTNVEAPALSEQDYAWLVRILQRYRPVMSTGPDDFGCTPLMSFSIETGANKPVAARYRPVPAQYEAEVKKSIEDMLTNGIIEPADSAWNSTLVLVRKPNGKLRICVNLKGVNALTINSTSYPINLQEQSFARLCNGKYFFRLDLSQAYYAIPLESPSDRDKTAFSVFGKQYRFKVSPFGARYLPSRFNKLMTQILDGLDHYLFYYFDDVIGAFQTPEELLEGLADVLHRLLRANLRVNFAKSDFCLTSLNRIQWLGSVIQNNTLMPDSQKIKAITDMPLPKTRHGVMRFLGAVNYHRRHIPHLANFTAPLSKLTSAKVTFHMGPEQIEAFNALKELLVKAPALALPDTSRPFIITTDASDIGVGGVLSQIDPVDQSEKITAYCSRSLTSNEQNGSSCEKEILAILYATSVFHFYIANGHFTLRSDSRSLVFLRHFKNINGKLFRASLLLDELSFDIEHVSATRTNLMGVADMISRAYGPEQPEQQRATYKDLRNPIYEAITAPPNLPNQKVTYRQFNELADNYLSEFKQQHPMETMDQKINYIEMEKDESQLISLLTCYLAPANLNNQDPSIATPCITHEIRRISFGHTTLTESAFIKAQHEDGNLQPIVEHLTQDPHAYKGIYFLIKGILCKRHEPRRGVPRDVIVVPTSMQSYLISYYHGAPTGAHRGRKLLYNTLSAYFHWSGLAKQVTDYCQKCAVCIFNQPNTAPQVVLERTKITVNPNELLNIDIVGQFPRSADGMIYILTVQCDFTKYVMAFPIRNKSAEIIVRTLNTNWIAPFGRPKIIRSDEGTDCDSALMQTVCKSLGIQKIRTPIYSPQANPVERWHATLNRCMRSWLMNTNYKYWPTIVPWVAHAYNTSVNTVTNCSAQELFFGRQANAIVPVLPDDHPALDKTRYLRQLKKALDIFWGVARRNLHLQKVEALAKGKNKPRRTFEIGQHVLIRNQAPEHKLSQRWLGPFRIVEVKHNALHVVLWDINNQDPYRLHHHAANDGQLVQKVVHPKDTKPWDLPLPKGDYWDESFAQQLFKAINVKYQISEIPSVGTTLDSTTTTRRPTDSQHDTDSEDNGPPNQPPPAPPPNQPPPPQEPDNLDDDDDIGPPAPPPNQPPQPPEPDHLDDDDDIDGEDMGRYPYPPSPPPTSEAAPTSSPHPEPAQHPLQAVQPEQNVEARYIPKPTGNQAKADYYKLTYMDHSQSPITGSPDEALNPVRLAQMYSSLLDMHTQADEMFHTSTKLGAMPPPDIPDFNHEITQAKKLSKQHSREANRSIRQGILDNLQYMKLYVYELNRPEDPRETRSDPGITMPAPEQTIEDLPKAPKFKVLKPPHVKRPPSDASDDSITRLRHKTEQDLERLRAFQSVVATRAYLNPHPQGEVVPPIADLQEDLLNSGLEQLKEDQRPMRQSTIAQSVQVRIQRDIATRLMQVTKFANYQLPTAAPMRTDKETELAEEHPFHDKTTTPTPAPRRNSDETQQSRETQDGQQATTTGTQATFIENSTTDETSAPLAAQHGARRYSIEPPYVPLHERPGNTPQQQQQQVEPPQPPRQPTPTPRKRETTETMPHDVVQSSKYSDPAVYVPLHLRPDYSPPASRQSQPSPTIPSRTETTTSKTQAAEQQPVRTSKYSDHAPYVPLHQRPGYSPPPTTSRAKTHAPTQDTSSATTSSKTGKQTVTEPTHVSTTQTRRTHHAPSEDNPLLFRE